MTCVLLVSTSISVFLVSRRAFSDTRSISLFQVLLSGRAKFKAVCYPSFYLNLRVVYFVFLVSQKKNKKKSEDLVDCHRKYLVKKIASTTVLHVNPKVQRTNNTVLFFFNDVVFLRGYH